MLLDKKTQKGNSNVILPLTDGWYPCGNLEMASSLSAEQSLPKLEPDALGLKPGMLGGVTFLAPWLKR
jgi:hypothetical protein